MAKDFRVSQSKIKTWRRCHAAYHYKYVLKLKKKVKSRPLKFGDIMHQMLEAEANQQEPSEILHSISLADAKLFTAEKEMYGEIIEDIGVIMEHYFDYWDPNALIFIRKNGKNAEHEFDVEISPGIILTGKIDAVIKTPKNGLKWLEENKSFGKVFPEEEQRWRNLQSVTYFRALEMLGWFNGLSGIMWNYICSKPPTKPQLLKNGKLSTKAITTLPGVVESTIKQHGLRRSDYKELIHNAENNQGNYFQRIFTPVNRDLIDMVFKDTVDTAREMMQYHGTKQEMNIDKHCSWCDYEKICRAKMTCSDFEFIIEREYTHGNEEVNLIAEEKLVRSE